MGEDLDLVRELLDRTDEVGDELGVLDAKKLRGLRGKVDVLRYQGDDCAHFLRN